MIHIFLHQIFLSISAFEYYGLRYYFIYCCRRHWTTNNATPPPECIGLPFASPPLGPSSQPESQREYQIITVLLYLVGLELSTDSMVARSLVRKLPNRNEVAGQLNWPTENHRKANRKFDCLLMYFPLIFILAFDINIFILFRMIEIFILF